MTNTFEILKVPAVNVSVVAATTWVESLTDVLSVMLLLATLIWTLVKIAKALKDFHGEE